MHLKIPILTHREELRFEQHYRPMLPQLYSLAFRLLRSEEDAKDVVQDVLLKLWQMRHQLPPDGAEIPFVHAMVRNRCLNLLRDYHTEPLQEDVIHTIEPSPDTRFEAQDFLDHLLSMLPEKPRLIVQLRIVEGLSFEQIEQQTGISAGNARVILSRTLQQLRQ